jgi:hypothetical protein
LFKASASLRFYLLFLGLVPIVSGYSLLRLRGVFDGKDPKIIPYHKRIIR